MIYSEPYESYKVNVVVNMNHTI